LRHGTDIVFIGLGPIVARGLAVADRLAGAGWSVGAVDARFALPLDRDLILGSTAGARLVVTLEESALPGGFGSAVLEVLAEARTAGAVLGPAPSVLRIGIPAGRFIDHGAVADLRRVLRLDEPGIQAQVEEAILALGLRPPVADGRSAGASPEGPAASDGPQAPSARPRVTPIEARPA
jgi:1-deoxy-D-xylulose-5-phosphate synthase